jgi:hypothetical protein
MKRMNPSVTSVTFEQIDVQLLVLLFEFLQVERFFCIFGRAFGVGARRLLHSVVMAAFIRPTRCLLHKCELLKHFFLTEATPEISPLIIHTLTYLVQIGELLVLQNYVSNFSR